MLVLRDVPELVSPYSIRWFVVRDDHVAERDRTKTAPGQNEMGEPSIADVQKAPVASTGKRQRQETDEMADRVRMMRDEQAKARAHGFIVRPGPRVSACVS
jgi:hypothetical protein